MMRLLRRLSGLSVLMAIVLVGCNPTDHTDHQGNSGRFSDYQGQWLVINYWAVWCKPCIEEIPELNQLAHDSADSMVVLGVDFDGDSGAVLAQKVAQKVAQKIEQLGIDFPVLQQDPAVVLGFPRPNVLPTTVLIDPQGQLHRILLGPQTEESIREAAQAPSEH